MNDLLASSTFKKIVGGAVLGAVLACCALIVLAGSMGHGGTAPVAWISVFAQFAAVGALAGALLGAIARLVDGPG